MKRISVYTDGACKGNPGIGGWGWVEYITLDSCTIINRMGYGGITNTTNNRMEMQALIEYLSTASNKQHRHFIIHSDSKYIVDALVTKNHNILSSSGLYYGWITKWGPLDESNKKNISHLINNQCIIELLHVPGHTGIEGNEKADEMANRGVVEVKQLIS